MTLSDNAVAAGIAPVCVQPGAIERSRRRAIGGCFGRDHDAAARRCAAALGTNAALLDTPRPIVGDWDACYAAERHLEDTRSWRDVLTRGEIADVEGPFVIAWLGGNGAVNVARDGIGERTAYYYADGERFIFASTLGAVVDAALHDHALDGLAVARFLAYAYLPGAPTLFERIVEILPGEQLTWHGGTLTRTQFWRPPDEPQGVDDSEQALRERLRHYLDKAVWRRLGGGFGIGASLSGGVDSSLVVALAGRHLGAALKTYSVSFGDGFANELEWSSLVARHCETDHRIIEMSAARIATTFDRTIACLDKPNGDPLTVPNFILFEEAASEIGVMLNGEGGDPCFGGPKNVPMLLSELFGTGGMFESTDDSRAASYLRAHQKCYDDFRFMLCDGVLDKLRDGALEAELGTWLSDPRYPSFINRLMALNVTFKGAHHILPKVDALSAAHGVLPRSPLFDRRVTEHAFAIPATLKLRGSVEKYLLKQAVLDTLPASIIERPKSGMLVPVEAWFRGPLRKFAQERLLDGLAPYGIVRRDYLESLFARRARGHRPRIGIKIWLLLTLESWLRQHTERLT